MRMIRLFDDNRGTKTMSPMTVHFWCSLFDCIMDLAAAGLELKRSAVKSDRTIDHHATIYARSIVGNDNIHFYRNNNTTLTIAWGKCGSH